MPSGSLTAKVTVHGYRTGRVQRIEVREQHGKHQIALVDLRPPASARTIPPEQQPVVLTWGYSPSEVRSFYGYVNHYEMVSMPNGAESVLRLVLIGTSLPFNDPKPSSWSGVTASYIVRQVAERHRLRVVTHASKEVLDYWAQGTETDWEMLRRLAEKVGYRFWVDGSTLHFLDPERLVRSPRSMHVPTLRMQRKPWDNLLAFSVIAGSLAPREALAASIREVYGLNVEDGRTFKVTSAKAISDRSLPRPGRKTIHTEAVKDAAEARRVAEAYAAQGRWVTAEAHTTGEAVMRIGDIVNVLGVGIHPDHQGVWLVDGCVHIVERESNDAPLRLYNDLTLSRNRETTSTFRAVTPLLGAPRMVPARLRNGAWESELLESVYV